MFFLQVITRESLLAAQVIEKEGFFLNFLVILFIYLSFLGSSGVNALSWGLICVEGGFAEGDGIVIAEGASRAHFTYSLPLGC